MKVILTTTLKNIVTGDPIPWDDKTAENATLRKVLVEALSAPMKDPSPVDLVKHYDLAKKIVGAGNEEDFTTEQIALMKDLIAKRFPVPLVAGAAFEALEGGA